MNRISTFSNGDMNGEIFLDGDMYTVRGTLSSLAGPQTLRYWAAAPTERRQSLVGSGLPFANEEQAMDSSPNQGSFQINNGRFDFAVRSPNAYYTCQGNTLVYPHVNLFLEPLRRQYTLELGTPVPNRSLLSLPGRPNRQTYR